MFLVLTVDAEPDAEDRVRDFVADLSGLRRSVGFRIPDGDLQCVLGIGSSAWDRLFDGPRPRELHPFKELRGARHHAPATPGDLLVHIRARRMDLCFELATLVTDRLAGAATVVDEVHGFKYFDERDLMGFVDGTENPEGQAARDAVTIGDEDPDFAGASYVVVQKYLHDMRSWNALPVEAQEKVIGRTKLSDVELADDVKPIDSHVALTTITDPDGTEREILRDNMPFDTVGRGEFGTYFIGYSATPEVTERMLENMFIGNPPGTYDRILDFSTAMTGCLFFVPTADFLDDPPGAPTSASGTADTAGMIERPVVTVPPDDDFVDPLAASYEPIDPLFRLAEQTGVVLLNGGGFDGPEWSVRVSPANLDDLDHLRIGHSRHRVFGDHHREWRDTPDQSPSPSSRWIASVSCSSSSMSRSTRAGASASRQQCSRSAGDAGATTRRTSCAGSSTVPGAALCQPRTATARRWVGPSSVGRVSSTVARSSASSRRMRGSRISMEDIVTVRRPPLPPARVRRSGGLPEPPREALREALSETRTPVRGRRLRRRPLLSLCDRPRVGGRGPTGSGRHHAWAVSAAANFRTPSPTTPRPSRCARPRATGARSPTCSRRTSSITSTTTAPSTAARPSGNGSSR